MISICRMCNYDPFYLRMRKRSLICLLFSAVLWAEGAVKAPSEAIKMDEFLLRDDLWTMSKDDFTRHATGYRFRWVSTVKDSARSTEPGTFLGEKVIEAIIRFNSNHVNEVQLSFYNRGDSGDIAEEVFTQRVDSIEGKIRDFAGKPIKDISPKESNTVERKSRTTVWTNGVRVLRFEHAFTRVRTPTKKWSVRPEFVNLVMLKNDKNLAKYFVGDTKIDVSSMGTKKLVKKTESGDVVMDSVPMVDQGQKGYCAVATTERVLRYYGTDVNQHELAQWANTASGGGTDPASLVKALKAMTTPMGLNIKILMQYQASEFMKMVEDYNKAAKRQSLPTLQLATKGVIDVNKLMDAMNKDLFLKIRNKSPVLVDQFMGLVKKDVNDGHPILWGVKLGFVPEQPALPQARGGHIRLIIGYNPKTKEVLYSDSWGAGHELKRMKASDAYAISNCLIVIEPR